MQKVRNKQKGMIAGARVLGASLILSTSPLAPFTTVYAETGEGRVPNVTLPNGVPKNYDLTWFDELMGTNSTEQNGIILFQVSILKQEHKCISQMTQQMYL